MHQSQAFISYSHKDKKELETLRKHLKYLEQKRQLHIWDDRNIKPGNIWFQDIKEALARATVAVLLVSAIFLASDFIMEHELPVLLQTAREGRLRLLSVVVGPCAFYETELAQFQALNEQPLALLPKARREEVWVSIAQQISAALQRKK